MKELSNYLYYKEDGNQAFGLPDIKIYIGDNQEILPLLPNFDLCITDPPYGIGVDNAIHKKSGQKHGKSLAHRRYYENTDWDYTPPCEVFDMIFNATKEQIIFGGNFFELPPSRCWLVWDKQNGSNEFADCELAWTSFDQPIRIKRHMWNGMLRKGQEYRYSHPTQKPLEVIKWAIQQCKYWDTPLSILDPFGGSGTTAVACKEMKKDCTLIEISEKYCEIAVKRLKNTQVPFL